MTQSNLLDLAKQGDTRALTSLLNRSLQSRGIVAKATKRNDTLHILLEAEAPPSQAASVRCIQQGLEKLSLVDTPVTIYGRQAGQTSIAWQEHLTAPINRDEIQSELFDSELLDDNDSPIPTGGEPTQVSEDWSDQATAIEPMDPVPPPPPGMSPAEALGSQPAEGNSWDSFDFQAGEISSTDALEDAPAGEPPSFDVSDDSWGAGMPVDYSPEDPEPTLIVPDEGDEDLDGSLGDDDADSEILLSLWDDANLAEDDLDTSGDVSVDNLQLWQEGESEGQVASLASEDQPMLVGEPSGSSKNRDRKGAAVPLIFLLGLLAMLGGVATAARLGAFSPSWLANIPGVGPLLVNSESSDKEAGSLASDSPTAEGNDESIEPGEPGGDTGVTAASANDQSPGASTEVQPSDNEVASNEVASADSSAEGGGQTSSTTSESGETADGAADQAGESGESNSSGENGSEDSSTQQTDVESASDDSSEKVTEAVEASVGESFDPFRKAVNAAQTAANLTQTASTSGDWSEVSDYWSIAVENMQAVPKNHPRYDTAQQKVSEYQKNLAYAQQFFQ